MSEIPLVDSNGEPRLMEDIFVDYVKASDIDGGLLFIISQHKAASGDGISICGINAKTAHLIRAGLSAGRLLADSPMPPAPRPRPRLHLVKE